VTRSSQPAAKSTTESHSGDLAVQGGPQFSYVPHPIYPWNDQIRVDGLLDTGSLVNASGERRRVKIANPAIAGRVLDMSCRGLCSHFEFVSVPVSSGSAIESAYLHWDTSTLHPEPTVEFSIARDLRGWCSPWTPVDYIDRLKRVASKYEASTVVIRDEMYLKFGAGTIAFPMAAAALDERARDVVERHLPIAAGFIRETLLCLQSEVPNQITLSLRRFPEQVSVCLEQYLLYSFEFLQDLAIEFTATIREEEHELLFVYTATSQDEALTRLSEALQLYLRLPADSEFPSALTDTSDIATAQLIEIVEDFRKRVLVLENRPHHHLTKDRDEEGSHPKENEESLITRYVSLRPITFGPFEFHPLNLLHKLKRKRK
jgi:hypothetical protein